MVMKKLVLISTVILLALAGCSENADENKNAVLTVLLTDNPGTYEEVLIDVQEVRIHVSSADDESGWLSLENMNKGIYNLLDFTNGMDTVLAEQELPAGEISQIRLVLGENNQVKVDGVYHDLKTPSAQQSGLKLNIHAVLTEGITYRIWIDFDAGRSIVEQGNGKYSLKPVIRTYTDAISGAIKGVIDPVEAKPYIRAVSTENDTMGTFADTTSGHFLISGLEAGNYTIEVLPTEEYQTLMVENIAVLTGEVYDLDTVIVSKL